MKKFISVAVLLFCLTGLTYSGSKTTPNSNLYGWFVLGESWQKLTVNELAELIVRCSTQSTVKIIDNDATEVVEVETAEIDEVETTWYGLWTNSRMYGFFEDTDSWSRLRLNEMYELIVRTSTQSTVKIIDNDATQVAEVEVPGIIISSTNYALDTNSFAYGFGLGVGWTGVNAFTGNADDVITTMNGLSVQSFLYGYNPFDNDWDRLRLNEMWDLIVRCSTQSTVKIIDEELDTAEVDTGSNDDEVGSQEGLVTNARLYGYEAIGGVWDRCHIDLNGHLWVRTSTNSVMQSRNYFWSEDATWERGISNELDQQIVECSTKSTVQIIDSEVDIAEVDSAAADAKAATQNGVVTNSRLHGYNGADSWDRLLSDIHHHLWVRLSSNSHVIVDELFCSSDDAHVTVYPGVTFPVEQANQAVPFNVSESTVNIRYEILDSTYIYRNFYANGTITAAFDVKSIAVYSQGGHSTITWDAGDLITVWDSIPFGDIPIDETFDQPVTFTCALTAPTTFSIYVRGIRRRKN